MAESIWNSNRGGGVRRFRKVLLVAWAVVLAVSLPGFGGDGGGVLCFSADGHVAFETAAPDGVCSSAAGRATPPLAGFHRNPDASSRQDHCGPCVDIPSLSRQWANTSFSSQLSGHLAWAATSPSPISLPGDEIPASAGGGGLVSRLHTPSGAPCAYLRTTVLLI